MHLVADLPPSTIGVEVLAVASLSYICFHLPLAMSIVRRSRVH
jgi:hypothetical protein